jgi:hypothetical protein
MAVCALHRRRPSPEPSPVQQAAHLHPRYPTDPSRAISRPSPTVHRRNCAGDRRG